MRIGVAVRALLIAKSVSHDPRTTPKLLLFVASRAFDLGVSSFERVASQLLVLERFDLERRSEVTGVTSTLGLGQAELPGVHVAVATCAFARHTAIGRSSPAETVSLRRSVATITGRLGVRAGERPYAVIDLRRLPSAFRMAMRATAGAHLGGKLLAVRVLVAVAASSRLRGQRVSRPLRLVAIAAGNELVSCFEGELSSPVLLDGKSGRPEPVHVVARGTVDGTEGSAVHVAMTVGALLELETPKSLLRRKLGGVAAPAIDVTVQALEREAGEWMSTKPNLRW
jgi:hypothetical protein